MRCIAPLFASLCLVAVKAQAQIPAHIQAEMQFLVGDWTTDARFNDVVQKGRYSAQWAPDKQCLILNIRQGDFAGTGIAGWDPATKEWVETWYRADGARVEVRTS